VPVIGAFVALLVALSALDLLAGNVTAGRLAGHLPVIIGLALLLLRTRLDGQGGGTTGDTGPARAEDRGWFARRADGGFDDGGGLQPTAHHRAA
jgi:hypothetical protein